MKNSDTLQTEINSPEPCTFLNGEYVLSLSEAKIHYMDGRFLRNLITVTAEDKIIDGSGALITVRLDNDPGRELSVFHIVGETRDLTFRNIKLNILYTGEMSGATVYGLKNYSYGLTVKDCKIDFTAENQINYTAIYNDGKLDSNLETSADRFTVCGNQITAAQTAQEVGKQSLFCGIDNVFANSASISDNYIFMKNVGNGEMQQAIGVRNSGWYMRLEKNNIKGNGSHSMGNLLEQAHAYGVYNTGNYMIFVGNNCVAEWGGKCVGLYNAGLYANITGNKILATHTIMGRSLVLLAERTIVSGNLIANTSRNPHFIDVFCGSNSITNNYIQGLMFPEEQRSGCGIFILGEENRTIQSCTISNNTLSNIKDFGIVLINTQKNRIQGNYLVEPNGAGGCSPIFTKNSDDQISDNIPNGIADRDDMEWGNKLRRNYDEAVCSLYE